MDKKHFAAMAKTAALGAALALTVACNGGGGSSAKPCDAAVFTNNAYVDYSIDGAEGSEAANMEDALVDGGFNVRTFTGTTAAEISSAVSGCRALVIPEQETGSLSAVLTPDEHTVIADFVNNGGNLIVAHAGGNTTSLVNGLFGWGIASTADLTPIELDANDAPGTTFEGGTTVGGTSLTSPSATSAFTAASLPMGARSIYTDANGNASVAMMQVGAGSVTLLGWDYYDAIPNGVVDDGWIEVLYQAVVVDALEMQIPLTDVAVADVEARGWSTCFTAFYDDSTTMVADALAACGGTEMMVACRQTGSPDLALAAWATKAEITVDTNAANDGVTNDVGGVSWYYNPDWSWGFASLGDPVNKNQCDTNTTGKDNQRMCWHTGIFTPGQFLWGYRCGQTYSSGTDVERVLLTR